MASPPVHDTAGLEMSSDIGPRLRNMRQRHGLSQRALAKRSGISNATISLIESRKLNPSVAVLKRILDGVPMDLSTFFADEDPQPEPAVFRSEELVEIARNHGAIGAKLTGAGGGGAIIALAPEDPQRIVQAMRAKRYRAFVTHLGSPEQGLPEQGARARPRPARSPSTTSR